MASIFKRSKKKKNEPYLIQYTDHRGKRRTEVGFTEKSLTEQLAAKLESETRLRSTGMIDAELERFQQQKDVPITVHLDAFEESLTDNSSKHVRMTMSRVRRVVAGCGVENLAGFSPEEVQKFLRSLRKTENIGHRTYNHYLQAIDSFLHWCVLTKRLIANPLIGLERLNIEVDVRRKRRALTAEEVGKLVASARGSGIKIQRYTGEERARIYIVSYMTGLRKNEIASLTPRSFRLDDDPPTLTVEAASSKHRKKDVLPLHPELVPMLREWTAGLASSAKLFPKLDRRKTWYMVQRDLERAGIPYENDDGVADFHAAGRHSHITELLRNGTSLPEAKELARHSDVKMTMRYTHIGLGDRARAVAKLPAPRAGGKPAALAAPSDDRALQMRCISGGFDCPNMTSDVTSTPTTKSETPCGSRGLGTVSRQLSPTGKLEAAGIEPAS